jgi:hypothetical protein
MTNQQQHPITPPPELVQQWAQMKAAEPEITRHWNRIATQAARWAADEQLKKCHKWVADNISAPEADELWVAMRPKSSTLKERAIEAQQRIWNGTSTHADWELVRQALEALPGADSCVTSG